MTGEPEYQQHDYIGAREQQAYIDSGGAQADAQIATGGIFAMPPAMIHKVVAQQQANEAAAEYGHKQAQMLSQNHRLWDKPAELGNSHYLSFPHKELKRFVTDKFDPNSVHEAGRYYNKVGNDLIEFSGRIRDAALKTEQSWQGRAGDAMRAKMTGLADHMGHSGEAAQLTGNQLGMQAEAGERARNSMPEVVEVDVASEMQRISKIQDPAEQTKQANELQDKQAQAQAAHQEAAQVMTTMEGDFGSAAVMTPKFAPPPPPPSESGGAGGVAGGTGGVGGFVSPPGGSGGGTPSSTYSASAAPSVSAPSSGGGYTPGPSGSQVPAGTSSSWANSGSTLPPGVVRGPDGTLWRQGPNGEWLRQNPYNGRWAPAPQGPPGAGGRGGPGGGRAGSGGVGGRAGGGAVGDGRAGGGFGPRGSVAGNPLGAGGQSGGGRVPGTPGSAAASSAATSSSSARGGRMPMGAMGAGHGQDGADEEEHERKYVLETDEAFEELGIQRVAPPVLGALPDEDGGR